jgi:NAD+ synthase
MFVTHLLEALDINTALARRVLVEFIRQELAQVGFEKAVIGLSGGIDSAVVAYLTAEALGPENVLAIRMPYQSSAQASLDDAQKVIDALDVRHMTVPITPMVEPLFEAFPEVTPLRRGNIMARQRMIVLYDQSAAFGGLVVGTSNKTEALLGYSTLFGDSAAAIHPIGDLYKYQVRLLAAELGVPETILQKAPSADLWPGQTDESELGYSYDEADQILYLLVDERYALKEAVEAGFPEALVEGVWETVRKMQYKRRLPLIPKISRRTLGIDFRYLRDWGARRPD